MKTIIFGTIDFDEDGVTIHPGYIEMSIPDTLRDSIGDIAECNAFDYLIKEEYTGQIRYY